MKIALCSVLLLVSSAAMAGQQTGSVASLRVTSTTTSSNPSHVLISGTGADKPSCATLPYWAFDSDTVTGKNFLATLLTAQASGRDVIVYGTGECGLRPGMESIAEIDLAP